jgi:UDP-N-acetylglucosamine acyltransferase
MLVEGVPAVVHGVNVVGLRRAGMAVADRRALRDAHRILFRSGLTPKAALERVRREVTPAEPVRHLVEFIETARHGILGPASRPPEAGDLLADPESETVA